MQVSYMTRFVGIICFTITGK